MEFLKTIKGFSENNRHVPESPLQNLQGEISQIRVVLLSEEHELQELNVVTGPGGLMTTEASRQASQCRTCAVAALQMRQYEMLLTNL